MRITVWAKSAETGKWINEARQGGMIKKQTGKLFYERRVEKP